MDFENFKDLVKNTRTTRRFLPNITVDKKELLEVIDLARVSSSAKNMQPLKYITVTNKALVSKLSLTCKWATHLTTWVQSKDEQPSAFIIVLNDTSIDGFELVDCGISLQTIMLALKIKGYASCPLASIDKEVCKESFDLEEHIIPLLGIAVGKQAEKINIVQLEDDTNYYRDTNDEHCVPKRDLKDIVLGSF